VLGAAADADVLELSTVCFPALEEDLAGLALPPDAGAAAGSIVEALLICMLTSLLFQDESNFKTKSIELKRWY